MRAVSVLYGSQTGCAESIAQQIYNDALARQLDAALIPLNDFQKANLVDKPGHHVIIVCSTTGNGEPPDNAGKFWRFVKRRTQPKDMLANLAFTVLGLGDTNYDRFCYMGKSIDKRFTELGARRYYAMCAADEALGLEDMVEPWLAGLWEAFDKSCGPSVEDDATASSSSDGGPESEPVPQPVAEPKHKNHADLQRHLPANLISFEAMFGPLTGPTQVPDDLPRLQPALFTTQCIDESANEGSSPSQMGESASPQDDEEPSLSKPFLASVVGAKYLTSSQSERKVMSMDIDLGESGIRFKPGDSIGVKCPNPNDEVDTLLSRLDLDGTKRVAIEAVAPARTTKRATASSSRYPPSITVRDLFLHHTDIRSTPKKAVMRALATYCTDEEERAQLLLLSSKLGADKYQAFVVDQQLSFLEVLLLFPSCQPPLAHVLSLVPHLMPRYYSIASSPLADPKRVTVAFTVVKYTVGPRGIPRSGLCSNWLQRIAQPLLDTQQQATTSASIKIPLFLRSTRDFEPPANRQSPMLLIGPGTGVAPFIGFLQHRHFESQIDAKAEGENADSPVANEAGAISLFFGCRRKSEDWIFKDEMHAYLENGTLSALFTAFSREQEEKHYVQHDLKANGKLVYDFIQESGGYVFVCGDGVSMARDVHAALVDIVKEQGNMSADAAEARLRELSSSQRYVRDIW